MAILSFADSKGDAMPKYENVDSDGRGGWYFKATIGRDADSGKRRQITRRGFATAAEAARARREEIERPAPAAPTDLREVGPLTLNELLDKYLEGLRADNRLSIKTIHDHEGLSRMYVRPSLGHVPVRDLTSDLLLSWQRRLSGHGKEAVQPGLAPNTIRLARAPLSGALKLAVSRK